MRRVWLGVAFAIILVLDGCGTFNVTSGKYLQSRHVVSDEVIVQLTYPTKDGCAAAQRSMAYGTTEARQAQPYTSCRDSTASAEMHAIAFVRDKVGNYTFVIETRVLSLCSQMLAELLKVPADSFEVISDCKAR